MNRKIILLPLSALLTLGLASCDLGPGKESVPASEPVTTSEVEPGSSEPGIFDGGISDIEIGVDCMISGVIGNILSNGNFTIVDGKASAYCYGSLPEGVGLGDYVNITGEVANYFGQREIKSPQVTKRDEAAPAIMEAVEITGADVQAYREAIDTAKAANPVVGVDPQMQKAYKVTAKATVDVDGYAGFEFEGVATKLVSHYYAAKNNVTEGNRSTQLYAGCVYDIRLQGVT